MLGKLEDIHRALPELLSDFESIQNACITPLEASRAIAKSFQERLDLYYSRVIKVEGDFAIFDTIFGSQKDAFRKDIEIYLAHLPNPIEIHTHPLFSKIVSEKALRLATSEAPEDTTFSSLLLPATASWVWFPIIKQDKVISIIELGSETIMELQKYWNDKEVIQASGLAFQTMQLKINHVLENTRD